MFKSKSFDLNSDESTNKTENLYQPRRIRWLNYILFPLAVGFVILLIISNVDFSHQPEADTDLKPTTRNINIQNKIKNHSYANETVTSNSYANETVTSNSYSSLCRLQSLQLVDCVLLNTEDEAFEQQNLQELLYLELNYTKLAIQQQYSEHSVYRPGDLFGIHFELSNNSFITLRYLNLSGKQLVQLSKDFLRAVIKNFALQLKNNVLDCSYKELAQMNPCNVSMENSRHLISLLDSAENEKETRIAPPVRTTPKNTETTTTTQTNTTQPVETEPMETEPIPTTTPSVSELYNPLICVNAADETVSQMPITYNVSLRIMDNCESGVNIVVQGYEADSCSLIYFAHKSLYNQVNSKYTQAEDAAISIDIQHLNCNTSYVFCLLVTEAATSPFTCQSYHTAVCDNDKSGWFEAHSVLIVSLGIFGMLLCVVIGLLLMYSVLWLRPTWLRGSKRLVRSTRDSQIMLLMSRIYEKEIYGNIRNEIAENSNGEYITHYRHLERPKLSIAESNKYIIPPEDRAPIKPPIEEHTIKSNSYTYESFDLYEELV